MSTISNGQTVPKYKMNMLKTWKQIKYYKYIYLLMLPGLLYFIIYKYVPIYGLQLAFKNFMPNEGITGSPWVGLEHFINLVSEKDFIIAFRNTIILSLMRIAIGFPVPIILTLLINELRSKNFKSVLQTVLTFPHFLSWVILSGICFNLFSGSGAINGILTLLGFEKVNVLTNKDGFRWFLTLSAVWKEAGWSTILYLAAITGIDKSIYEAATVDGANRFHKAMYITIPGISEMIVVSLILSVGSAMNGGFDQVFNLYNASVYEVSDIIDTYVYRISFQQAPNYGFSTAVGLFKGVTNFILLLTANQVVKLFDKNGVL